MRMIRHFLCPVVVALSLTQCLRGESLETLSNAVGEGAITVAADDSDRSDWEEIPWFEFDDDFSAFYPVDIDRVQMAHDSTHLYVRLETLEWDTEETWRVGTYLDVDQDPTTGYTGDFLPLGADYFLEDSLAFEFNAATQVDWGWQESGVTVRDQTNMLDVELAISRLDIGNPIAFDFILFANNFCCDFQMDDDIYPNGPGAVFTYEFGEAVIAPIAGDCNADGVADALDLACVSDVTERDAVLMSLGTLAGDLDGDGTVAFADFLVLSSNFGSAHDAYTDGNIDLMAGIGFADFLVLSSNFGKMAATSAVPEPAGLEMLLALTAILTGLRQTRGEFGIGAQVTLQLAQTVRIPDSVPRGFSPWE